jgi:hypothetical protein
MHPEVDQHETPKKRALCSATGFDLDQRTPFHVAAYGASYVAPTATQNVREAQATSETRDSLDSR